VLALEPENAEVLSKTVEVREAQRKARLEAILRRADLAARSAKWDEAISALNDGLASEPGNEKIQLKLAEVRESRRSARLEAAIRLANTSAQAGKWDIAIQSLNEILAIDPGNDLIRKRLVEVQTGQRESRLKALQAQARALAKAEKFEEALSAWGQYLALEPDDREKAQNEIESVKLAQGVARSYAEAQKAYARKNYEKTIGLLKEVIDRDVNYKDEGQTVYAIGQTHQAYSTDNGVTWQACGQDVIASRSDARLSLDTQRSRLYLATPSQGVMVSTDNCQSWQQSNSGLSNLFVNTLAIDPNNPKIVYTGTDGGAYITYDAGQTWGQINDGLLGATVVYSIAVDKDSNVYAATPYGIFKLESR
jgi:tetratricopeptide (TPR) repeat protein